uniref:nitroreductase/quinone reductase family protein n=1 Tax=Micromonospora polyrhachis TaxID=1282883 RepID=UPI0035E4260A
MLTTTGARPGRPRTQPLGLMQVDGEDLVVASAGGAPKQRWFKQGVTKHHYAIREVSSC